MLQLSMRLCAHRRDVGRPLRFVASASVSPPPSSHHIHSPSCPCSAAQDKGFYHRGMAAIHAHAHRFPPLLAQPPVRHERVYTTAATTHDPLLGDYAFEMATSSIRFGKGVTAEIGYDLEAMGARRVLVFADPNLAKMNGESPVNTILTSIVDRGLHYRLFSDISIEPTDSSFKRAIAFASKEPYDAVVAVGGGSTMDTAKAANLYACYPPESFLDYVNPPIGKGKAPPGLVKPLLAVPTTAGTGSETTGVAIFDLEEMHFKTGIAHRTLRPVLGIIDPNNTRTLPPAVIAASGFDVLCHALESYTALPYTKRAPRPRTPQERPAYQGANPISDFWSLKALEMTSRWLPISYSDPSNEEARAQMLLAATYAGIGFGNGGVHLCHGMSYPVSGMSHDLDFHAPSYDSARSIVPHVSVVLHAPAVFRFTASADPERHRNAAQVMGAFIDDKNDSDAGSTLVAEIVKLMRKMRIPNGLSALGYTEEDIPRLVEGTLPQHRVTKLSPRPVGREELTQLFRDSMTIYGK